MTRFVIKSKRFGYLRFPGNWTENLPSAIRFHDLTTARRVARNAARFFGVVVSIVLVACHSPIRPTSQFHAAWPADWRSLRDKQHQHCEANKAKLDALIGEYVAKGTLVLG